MRYQLGELADAAGAELTGDPELIIDGLATLDVAGSSQLAFLSSTHYRALLRQTRAAAVILRRADAGECPAACLVVDDPYLAFARVSQLFYTAVETHVGIHPTALISGSARIAPDASIGAYCTIADAVEIGSNSVLGPGCHISPGVSVGRDCRLVASVTVHERVRIGDRVLVHAGAVIGADGFGFAASGTEWVKIAQLGGVQIADDVEIGACTSIDRGTLGDTVIARGVKIDNQVQIAHNVRIGEHTAIAGCAGVAGSVRIGAHCRIGGGAGLVGHIEIADRVVVGAMSLVSHSIAEAGTYSSAMPLLNTAMSRRKALRSAELVELRGRIDLLEQQLAALAAVHPGDDGVC